MYILKLAIICLSLPNLTQALKQAKESFEGQQVIEFKITDNLRSVINSLDIWTHSLTGIQARVTPSQLEKLKEENNGKLEYQVKIGNLQKLVDDALVSHRTTSNWFDNYHTYDEIKTWYKGLEDSFGSMVKFVPSIGKSFEGRDIFAIHITNPNGQPKGRIYLQSLIHAREWITGSTLQYIVNHLLENQNSYQIKYLLDQIELICVPIVNPDGYSFSWTSNRLWRKNRQPYDGYFGVDLNRNFPYGWGGPGSSDWSAFDTYRGPSPASEPETQAVINYFNSKAPFLGAIDMHSYSQLILRPFSNTQALSKHDSEHRYLGDEMKKAIELVNGTQYINQKSIDLYIHSGTAADWFYTNSNKTYAYTIELSPKNSDQNGFVLPPSKIIPVGKDIIPAILYFMDYVLKNPLK